MLRRWPTPMANDGCKPSVGKRKGADLTHATGLWATPSARDWKSGHASPQTLARNSRPLNEQAVNRPSRPAPAMPMAGEDTSVGAPTLNPLFVEALMGWPTGWTGFGSVATAWSPWLRRMRCELWRLTCWPMDEGDAQ